MITPKHTPGPWYREMAQDGEYTGPGDNPPGYAGDWEETNEIIAIDEDGDVTRIGWAARDGDAALMVASPQLKEVVVNAVALFAYQCTDDAQKVWLESARAAIAKATGGQP